MNGDWTQLGIAGATLIILFFVIRYFISAMTKKDDQIIKMITDFNTTVSNHMDHQTDAFNALSNAIALLTQEIYKSRNGIKNKKRK